MGNNCCCGSPDRTDYPGSRKGQKPTKRQQKEIADKVKRGEGPDAEALYQIYEEAEEEKSQQEQFDRESNKKKLRSFEMKYTTGMSLRKQLSAKFEDNDDESGSSSNSEDDFDEPHRETEIVPQVEEKEKENFRSGRESSDQQITKQTDRTSEMNDSMTL